MKIKYLSILFVFCSFAITAQESFVLKTPNSKKLKKEFEKSEYQMNIILSYLEKNYKSTTGKLDIKKDDEMGGVECGFTKKFEYGIKYTYHNCGEAAPVKEKLIFPKTQLAVLKKWIEQIDKSNPSDIENTWYKGKNEYGPKNEEAGCYYKIKQTKAQSVIEISCGC
ncbi:hypothetical protein AAON49_08525 [Pseudotenacibaculum sp. MALMAid0570]|uniref:hypothetical protein n=1 Tax=Pseudotenacibaculum sp. MALMAid0570 TaxID=3143938 RepID=UPI0032DED77D